MAAEPPRAAAKVLLIEDDEAFREGVASTLRLAGFDVQAFGRAGAALHAVAGRGAEIDLVLTDLRLPDLDGLEVLARCRELDAELPVVVMTGHAEIETAVRAIKNGAYDFVEKPFGRERLVTLLQRAARTRALARENRGLRSQLASGGVSLLLGDSAPMRALRALVLRIAPTPVDVLVCGETGTGKELVARALHELSGRRGPFVAINCAALPETLIESELFGHESGAFTGAAKARIGRVEHADRGTLFLDEAEAMAPALQGKLLRLLQERELVRLGSNQPVKVDVRVVAASNAELRTLSAEGRFRADLYYRLAAVELALPPLRERREDIVPLFEHFRAGAALRFDRPPEPLPPALADRLLAYAWPGNVRELKSAAERQVLGLPALPGDGGDANAPARTLDETLASIEALLVADTMRRCGGRIDEACRELGLSQATLYRKLKAFGLGKA